MRRLVAFALVSALTASSALASSLHVHAYVGHDHPDHHHGPAAHEHEPIALELRDRHSTAEGDHDPVIQADSCDPGRHVAAVSMACADVPRVHVAVAELPGPATGSPGVPVRSALPVTDVRVHGPPFDPRIRSRAPPVKPHA